MTLEREAGDLRDICMSEDGGAGWSGQAHAPDTDGKGNCGGLRPPRVPPLCGVPSQATAHPFVCQEGHFSLLGEYTKYTTASSHKKGEKTGH